MGGEDARASDSRAPERERTKASRRSSVEGLTLIENFVTVDEEKALATLAATSGDETRLARRRVKHFGYAFDYGTRDANLKVVDEIPELAMEVLRRLPRETPGYEGAMRCDQVTVNEYPRGVGLAPHVDTHSAFESPCHESFTLPKWLSRCICALGGLEVMACYQGTSRLYEYRTVSYRYLAAIRILLQL